MQLARQQEAQRRFLERGATGLCDGERDRGRYMFHYARREHVSSSALANQKKRKLRHVDGETVRNFFVAFKNAAETLQFFWEWSLAERAAAIEDKTMVFECGSYADDIWRKWVIDVDADLAKLGPGVAEAWGRDDAAVVSFALDVSAELLRLGFLRRPCHFAITSRHVPGKKLSWHITLCALAPFAEWRRAIGAISVESNPMHAFMDKTILRNTRSQFMQIVGSTKVVMGQKGNGICFEPVGVFDGSGRLLETPHLFFAVSSTMLHDPYSLPFAKPVVEFRDISQNKPKQAASKSKQAASKSKQTASKPKQVSPSLQLLDTPQQPWMLRFIEARDGSTSFSTIPSMSDSRNWCDSVMHLVKKDEKVFYSYVISPSMCPRILAQAKQVGASCFDGCILARLMMHVKVYRHGSDCNAMVMCTSKRMFMLCFSSKCKKPKQVFDLMIQLDDLT